MAFNAPRSNERDNENSLRKYPLSDSASGTNGTVVIPPGAIIDAQVYVAANDPGGVWISEIGAGGVLRVSDRHGVVAETAAPITPRSAVPLVCLRGGWRRPGGVVVFGEAPEVNTLKGFGGQRFAPDETGLATSAVTALGLRGVQGIKLDDGNVVSGDVVIEGAGGCLVETFRDGAGVARLRISAIGDAAESTTTGFITSVTVDTDNSNFTVGKDPDYPAVVNICASGANALGDGDIPADQDSVCSSVKRASGSKAMGIPSEACDVCGGNGVTPVTLTFKLGAGATNTFATRTVVDGGPLGSVAVPTMDGKRFVGFFKEGEFPSESVKVYDSYGNGVGINRIAADATLIAHWIDAYNSVDVTFEDGGTLFLAAPGTSAPEYNNPVSVSGVESPLPVVRTTLTEELGASGGDKLADLVMNPVVAHGEVQIGLRGLDKAVTA